MIAVKRDFEDRVREIELYFSFMEDIMLKNAQLCFSNGSTENISSDLKKIFKANSFLILYNISESCIKNAIEEIFLAIKNNSIGFDKLKKKIKLEIIKSIKKNIGAASLVNNMSNIAYDIIVTSLDKESLFSGNIDAREIKKNADKYGFSSHIRSIIDNNGLPISVDTEKILSVKKNRNDLAHGTFSFKDCGKNYTIQDLIEIKEHMVHFLSEILDNIEYYILNEDYKDAT